MDSNEKERIWQDRGASKKRTKQNGEERFKEEAPEDKQDDYEKEECQSEE